MDGIGIAEEVVQIAKDLLVCAQQKCTENSTGSPLYVMQRKRLLHVAAIDELIHLAVRVTGDVAQNRLPGRRLVQAMDGHDGKKLLDGPAIGHALEQRKIAEIGIRQQPFQAFQFFGEIIEFLGKLQDLAANCPVEVLRKAALLQRKIAQD